MIVYALINKEVIPYICDKKKVTADFLHERTQLPVSKLNAWLDIKNPLLPTINQAKKLAAVLHVPFAGLYMNTADIPVRTLPSPKNFRSMEGRTHIDDSGLNIAISDVLLERDFLMEQQRELKLPSIQLDLPICNSDDPAEWASMIRDYFNIDLDVQFKSGSARQFYLYLRNTLESHGIFVQCFTDVPVEVARGFSIYENDLPIIGINDEDRPPAKSFTLIHELVHLLKRESTICNVMFNAKAAQAEEVFCNAVAGELLVPRKALAILIKNKSMKKTFSLENISEIAKRFSVSREVIIRRLLDTQYIDNIEYNAYADELRREIEQAREEQKILRKNGLKTGIPRDISREVIDRTSPAVSKLLYYGLCEDVFSKRDIAHHLGIAQKHVDKWIKDVSKWNS